MQTHFFMETVTTASGVWGAGAGGVCGMSKREILPDEWTNEWMLFFFKKKNPNQKLFKVTN